MYSLFGGQRRLKSGGGPQLLGSAAIVGGLGVMAGGIVLILSMFLLFPGFISFGQASQSPVVPQYEYQYLFLEAFVVVICGFLTAHLIQFFDR